MTQNRQKQPILGFYDVQNRFRITFYMLLQRFETLETIYERSNAFLRPLESKIPQKWTIFGYFESFDGQNMLIFGPK